MGIRVLEGTKEDGAVAPGDTFEWENYADSVCDISGTGAFLTASSYQVPAKSGTTPGTTSATVQKPLANGKYTYTASNSVKREQPTIHVNGSKP
jgi:hypothetical protein